MLKIIAELVDKFCEICVGEEAVKVTFTKTFLNFLTCWSLLWTQAVFGAEDGGQSEESERPQLSFSPEVTNSQEEEENPYFFDYDWSFDLDSVFNNYSLGDSVKSSSIWEWFTSSDSDLPEETVDGLSDTVASDGASSSVTNSLIINDSFVKNSSCHTVDTLNFKIPGINNIAHYFDEEMCGAENLRRFSSNGNEDANALTLCKNLEALHSQEGCQAGKMSAIDLNNALKDLREDEEMRELEIDVKAENIKNELKDLEKISAFQSTLSTDLHLMRKLFGALRKIDPNNSKDMQGFRHFKQAFELPDDFLSGQYTMNDFVEMAFQCTAVGDEPINSDDSSEGDSGSGNFKDYNIQAGLCDSQNLTPFGDDNSNIEARKRVIQNCREKKPGFEDCAQYENADPENLLNTGLINAVAANLYADARANRTNMALLDPEMGLHSIRLAHRLMTYLNNDRSDGKTPDIEKSLLEAQREAQEESREVAREKLYSIAFQESRDAVINNLGDRTSAAHKELLREFLDHQASLTPGDFPHLTFSSYQIDNIGQELVSFANDRGIELTDDDSILELVAMVQSVGIGQRMALSVSEGQIEDASLVNNLFTPASNENLSEFNPSKNIFHRVQSHLDDVKNGTNNDNEGKSLLKNLFGHTEGHGLFGRAAAFEGIFNRGKDSSDMLYGVRNLAYHMKNGEGSAVDKNNNPISPEKRYKRAKLSSLLMIAARSAKECRKRKSEAYRKKQFCNPLSNPKFGAKALEKLMRGNDPNLTPKNLLKKALMYCIPIRQVDFENRVVAQNYDPQGPFVENERLRYCKETTNNLFCDEECGGMGLGMDDLQEGLFGFTCDPKSQSEMEKSLVQGCSQMTADELSRRQRRMAARHGTQHILDRLNENCPESAHAMASAAARLVVDPENVDAAGESTSKEDQLEPFDAKPLLAVPSTGQQSRRYNFGTNGGQASDNPVFSANTGSGEAVANPGATSVKNVEGDLSGRTSVIPKAGSNGFNGGQPFQNYSPTATTVDNDDGEDSLVSTLREKKTELDPATLALLERLEDMEKRQADLQNKLDEALEEEGKEKEGERDTLLAEIKKLKSEIPKLEKKLKEKSEVSEILAQSNPAPQPSPSPTVSPVRRSSFGGGSGGRSVASVAAPQSQGPAPASAPSGANNIEGSEAISSGATSSGYSRSGGPSISSEREGGDLTAPLYTSDSVISLTSDIRARAQVVPPGVSLDDAILKARGPVLMPIGDEGEYVMYEPELTPDGQVVTRDGQVVFKAVVKVSDEAVAKNKGPDRLPASIEEGEVEIDPNYDPTRVYELNQLLDGGVSRRVP